MIFMCRKYICPNIHKIVCPYVCVMYEGQQTTWPGKWEFCMRWEVQSLNFLRLLPWHSFEWLKSVPAVFWVRYCDIDYEKTFHNTVKLIWVVEHGLFSYRCRIVHYSHKYHTWMLIGSYCSLHKHLAFPSHTSSPHTVPYDSGCLARHCFLHTNSLAHHHQHNHYHWIISFSEDFILIAIIIFIISIYIFHHSELHHHESTHNASASAHKKECMKVSFALAI